MNHASQDGKSDSPLSRPISDLTGQELAERLEWAEGLIHRWAERANSLEGDVTEATAIAWAMMVVGEDLTVDVSARQRSHHGALIVLSKVLHDMLEASPRKAIDAGKSEQQ